MVPHKEDTLTWFLLVFARARALVLLWLCGCHQVACPKCKYKSNTYDPFLDLSLGLPHGESSVVRAFKKFTAPERLRKGEEWRCARCNRAVRATKQLTVSRVRSLLPPCHLLLFAAGCFHPLFVFVFSLFLFFVMSSSSFLLLLLLL